ncbi:bleomycin resistance protein [Sphingomonas jaspsi]|uniref:bleomycin resistance protein n=1 Tax=Sphingomonas jaspsi TaxID=392409 RepID=UPI0004B7E266|nr:bleomycin resistance protein [Sphingomonas jaspsi]
MTDRATPNLPARDFDSSEDFYGKLGFSRVYRDSGWMILERGGLWLEFFPYADLDPLQSSFGACLRLDDLDTFHSNCIAAGIPDRDTGQPRVTRPKLQHSGMRIAYLVDPDGSLLRLVQNP